MSAHPETYSALVETLYQARLENRRLRISQLRRMALSSEASTSGWRGILSNFPKIYQDPISFRHRWLARHERFRAACLAEIERLRGMG